MLLYVMTLNLCIQIADFGLARDLAEENYYVANERALIPIKWTAFEALSHRKYSTASDVWSLGCLMYEIWGLGSEPYKGETNTKVCKFSMFLCSE